MSDEKNAYKELQERELYILTEFFKLLGDPTRIHILFLLMERDACVSDLADRLGLTQSAVSHQLSLLKANKLVRRRRDGKMIFYTLVDDHGFSKKERLEYLLTIVRVLKENPQSTDGLPPSGTH